MRARKIIRSANSQHRVSHFVGQSLKCKLRGKIGRSRAGRGLSRKSWQCRSPLAVGTTEFQQELEPRPLDKLSGSARRQCHMRW